MMVLISPRIRDMHPNAPTAGQQVVVCQGTYLTSDEPRLAEALRAKERQRPHLSLVPVLFEGTVWQIEEEYVESV